MTLLKKFVLCQNVATVKSCIENRSSENKNNRKMEKVAVAEQKLMYHILHQSG
jgi:hypothetical protein